IAAWPGSATVTSLCARPGWETLPAVKSQRVWEVPTGMLKRPAPAVIDGLERLAALLA
ncbi:MAG: cobalamin-binding protein, partial [Candidatus Rokubacteria bacterium]|nr:cobalamin-binding protein [Candidatus Rokubacteria bacterium]